MDNRLPQPGTLPHARIRERRHRRNPTRETPPPVKYISIFSGIEAATVAWRPLGWEPLAFSEIDPFPSTVLQHHYPNVPNLGDIESIPKQGVLVEAAGIDGRKKTFTIGNEKSPKIREVITGDGEPRLDNGQLRRVLSDSIFSKYHNEQIRLETGWDSGEMHEEIPDSEVIDWNTLFEQVNPQNGDRYELES